VHRREKKAGAGDGVWCPKYQSGRSVRISRALRFARVVFGSLAQGFDVERAVKQQDEQTGFIHSGLMVHGLVRREIEVRAGPDNTAIGIEPPLQHDDRMGGWCAGGGALSRRPDNGRDNDSSPDAGSW